MSEPSIPNVLAMLLCDQIIVDQQTNKKSLIGIFHQIHAFKFPASHQQMSVYAKLMDAEGEYEWKVRLVSLKDEQVLTELNIKTPPIPDPLAPTELVVNLIGLTFPNPGKYEFQLFANNAYLSRITVEIVQVHLPTGGTQWPQH